MKHLLLFTVMLMISVPAYAQRVSKGDICRITPLDCLQVIQADDVTVDDDLVVTDDSTFTGDATFNGLADFNGSLDASGLTYSSAMTSNPPVQGTNINVQASSVTSGQVILASAASKTITLHGYRIAAIGGATAGATTIVIECSGGDDIAALPVAMLTQSLVVGNFTSAPVGTDQSSVYSSKGIVGCPSGEAIQIAKTGGSVSGATSFELLLDYTVQ